MRKPLSIPDAGTEDELEVLKNQSGSSICGGKPRRLKASPRTNDQGANHSLTQGLARPAQDETEPLVRPISAGAEASLTKAN